MYFIKMGVDYRTTSLKIREKLTFSVSGVEQAMLILSKKEHMLENVILSTCNRTEIFALVTDEEKGKQEITSFLKDWFDETTTNIESHFKVISGEKVIRHIFKLTAGLESMVLGETQILGQVRDAFLMAQQNKTIGKYFNELLRRVITFGKRAQSDTVIGKKAVSVSYVAVELAKKKFGEMQGIHAVILGAGEMGETSLKNLHGVGVSHITIMNRSFQKAKALADSFQANAARIDKLNQVLIQADILISSTGAESFVLTKDQLADINKKRKDKPLIIIDIAVPRDIEDSVAELDNVFLYDMDDLYSVAGENMEKRKEAAILLEAEIESELRSYNEWLLMLDVIPIIKAMNDKSGRIQEKTLESIYRKIPNLEDREMKVLEKHTKSIVNQLLEEPIRQVKQLGVSDYSKEMKTMYKDMFINIFGLQDRVTDEEQC